MTAKMISLILPFEHIIALKVDMNTTPFLKMCRVTWKDSSMHFIVWAFCSLLNSLYVKSIRLTAWGFCLAIVFSAPVDVLMWDYNSIALIKSLQLVRWLLLESNHSLYTYIWSFCAGQLPWWRDVAWFQKQVWLVRPSVERTPARFAQWFDSAWEWCRVEYSRNELGRTEASFFDSNFWQILLTCSR